jgi:hypothetical protein
VELAAALAVLVACGVAGGVLYVLVAAPPRRRPPGDPPVPPVLAGLAPTVLAVFILLAGGTALTGAGTVNVGTASTVLAAVGIAVLAVVGFVVGRATLRALGSPSAEGAFVVPSPSLLVLAWAGAALALGSWLLAVGAVVVALLAGVRVERGRP